ncbi:unnamed protein product [Triticum aestivum]|uniref:Uncharacterized protein n=1 Tax=Triticum aestivum TaxID=4565 RepID=A0A7H4LFR2_WHEAT|nr:unnamed protein product [Triticum aestivum]
MGMQALMDVRCKNLVNHVCDWLGEIYEPASREFVIPGRGRLPLDEESVFCTLSVPRGEIKVPYEVNNKIEEAVFARLFPGMESMPNTTVLATLLEGMRTHGEAKLKDVKNMNWCKFIADFLHDAFSNKMYQKGYHLHLMLIYVDRLDLSTVNFTGIGGPPPPHKFAVSAWTYNIVKVVLAADKITDTTYGKLQLMAKHAIDYSVFGGPQNFGKWMDVYSAPSCPAEYDYNSSQELPNTQDELDGDAGLDKDDDNDMENVQREIDDDEHVEICVGGKNDKAAPKVPPPEEGIDQTVARDTGVSLSKRGRALEDVGQGSAGKRCRTDPVAARRRFDSFR